MPSDQAIVDALKQIVDRTAENDRALLEVTQALVTRVLEMDARLERVESRLGHKDKVDLDV